MKKYIIYTDMDLEGILASVIGDSCYDCFSNNKSYQLKEIGDPLIELIKGNTYSLIFSDNSAYKCKWDGDYFIPVKRYIDFEESGLLIPKNNLITIGNQIYLKNIFLVNKILFNNSDYCLKSIESVSKKTVEDLKIGNKFIANNKEYSFVGKMKTLVVDNYFFIGVDENDYGAFFPAKTEVDIV